jgi:hypothetical protein
MPHLPEQLAHQEWLGYVQPVGLVVSIPALLQAQAQVQRNIAEEHQRFLACLPQDEREETIPEIRDFPEFTRSVLGWEAADLMGAPGGEPIPAELEATLPGYNETLRPTYAVREFQPKDAKRPWMLLVKSLTVGTELDALASDGESYWQATPHAKFERLLRETQVPFGLLVNGTQVRMVYAPRGETSGYATFSVADMAKVAGRPIFAALHMLLNVERLFSVPERQRLSAILADSRKYQNVVSTQLAEQVLGALYELVRGFQAADEQRRGELLREVLAADPNHVYGGLLTVLLRLVFILYAEDRGLLSSDPVYSNYYSITGLFERLRADAGRYPDTMDQRYGAWAQLLTLFRMIYEGGRHGGLRIPARRGYLFDPDRYPFLEGRSSSNPTSNPPPATRNQQLATSNCPRLSDGVIYRVLEKLLVLDGERLSYRTLDVEQIGSVYETMMGFNLEVAEGRSIAIKPAKSHGAPTSLNLDALLEVKPADRAKWIAEKSDQKLAGQAVEALKAATTVDELLAGLDRKIAHLATPNVVPRGAMVLQPSDERRRSGSHYTPRSLTEPIVRTTLKPILEQLGEQPRPEQILALKVCDPAMGSGAFLVEACRQLGDALVEAWHFHQSLPTLPPDEDELLHARRLIAQRCLYGVDKNTMAVDLSKLSLWLATLAKDHPFTFLDHSLRAGDSLVGLSRDQIIRFTWEEPVASPQPGKKKATGSSPGTSNQALATLFSDPIAERMRTVTEYRQRILAARDDKPYEQLRQELDVADEALSLARLAGDCVIAAYFSASKDRERVAKLETLARQLVQYLGPQGKIEDRQPLTAAVALLHGGSHPLQPFHWQIEFPEVFTIDAKGNPTGGFDAIVGNPPFAGKNTIISGNREGYLDWLMSVHSDAHGNADLVAQFFRRAFNLIQSKGCFGLIATNTIGQGDTRSTGLRWICTNGGTIYEARRRCRWPGQAAVVVSVVHVSKSSQFPSCVLDGRSVDKITAYLFHSGGHDDPASLIENSHKSFNGTCILGMGFTFDDTANQNVATSLAEMQRLIGSDPRNAQRIRPYLGGEELNTSPIHQHKRFVIDFGDLSEEESRSWPELMAIIEAKVKPVRLTDNREAYRRNWWQFGEKRRELYCKISSFGQVIVISRISNAFAFALVPADQVLNEKIVVFADDSFDFFCILQSRAHEIWARLFSSTLKDDLQYTHSRCFENFPFPAGVLEHAAGDSEKLSVVSSQLSEKTKSDDAALTTGNWQLTTLQTLETAGREYYEFRAALMVRNNEGLTKTYNRFHDPHETSPDILQLRALHAAMDRAVLEAYGWHDLAQTATCEFLLDYEDDEDEEEPTTGRARTRKKPWRCRWPDDFRDEVLARLLALNAQRAEQECLAGIAAEAPERKPKKKPSGRKKGSTASAEQRGLPGM